MGAALAKTGAVLAKNKKTGIGNMGAVPAVPGIRANPHQTVQGVVESSGFMISASAAVYSLSAPISFRYEPIRIGPARV